jgi:glucan phosphoethanolaminetransferase (alkaline phosphatase superfamily)
LFTRIKIIMIVASLLLGYSQISDRVHSLLGPEIQPLGLVMYSGLFLLCVLGLFAAAFVNKWQLRWCFAVFFAAASSVVAGYQLTVQDHMSYNAFIAMMNASGAFHEAWGQHAGVIMIGALESLLMLLGIGLSPKIAKPAHQTKLILVPVLAIFMTTGILYSRGGDGGRGLPPSYTGSAYGIFYAYEKLTAHIAPRKPVTIPRDGKKFAGDIILIVDESISGQYLDINDAQGVRSGLKEQRPGVAIHNFGLASSIAHCSAAVNVTLRHGGTRDAYTDINTSMPSIWSYAKKAGMETVYLDTQRTGKTLNNMMDKAELKNIDAWVEFEDVPVQNRDHAAADKLANYINDGKPQFIYLNKIGAHFPIHDKFPDSFMHYKPVLPRGQFLHIADTGKRDGFSGTADSWAIYRNSYRNTLLWNVGAFFDRILAKADMANAKIIYTSDHGQNLHERGDAGVVTHCSPAPQIEEGLVPLVVLEASKAEGSNWDQAAKTGHNQSSHFRIFPTLLDIMGYNPTQVQKIYGENLLSPKPDPFTFNYMFNARLGRKPEWQKIDLKNIVRPPASDYDVHQLADSSNKR